MPGFNSRARGEGTASGVAMSSTGAAGAAGGSTTGSRCLVCPAFSLGAESCTLDALECVRATQTPAGTRPTTEPTAIHFATTRPVPLKRPDDLAAAIDDAAPTLVV